MGSRLATRYTKRLPWQWPSTCTRVRSGNRGAPRTRKVLWRTHVGSEYMGLQFLVEAGPFDTDVQLRILLLEALCRRAARLVTCVHTSSSAFSRCSFGRRQFPFSFPTFAWTVRIASGPACSSVNYIAAYSSVFDRQGLGAAYDIRSAPRWGGLEET